MGQKRYEISDEQWEQIKDIIQHSKMGRPPKDDRLMLNAKAELKELNIDSTSVKAHPQSMGAKKGL